MPSRTIELPKSGFALEVDGRLKTELATKEGAEHGAIELKRRFPTLQMPVPNRGRICRPHMSVHCTTTKEPTGVEIRRSSPG